MVRDELARAEHLLDVAERQVADQETSLLTLLRESGEALGEVHADTAALREKVRWRAKATELIWARFLYQFQFMCNFIFA